MIVRESKMKITRILSAVCCTFAIAALCGCGRTPDEKSAQTSVSVTTDAAVSGAITIDTEYGALYYPKEWVDHLRTTITCESGGLTVVFSANMDSGEYSLFEVAIGHEQGTRVGSLTAPDGQARDVYLQLSEIEFDSDSVDTDLVLLYAMQEDVNFVIDHLR